MWGSSCPAEELSVQAEPSGRQAWETRTSEREEEPELQASTAATREAVGGHRKSIMRDESGSKKVGG